MNRKKLCGLFHLMKSTLNAHIPENKSNLLKLREMGKARPFYQELCWKCQKYTEYDAWERRKPRMNEKESDPLQHLYEVLWRDPWEPFYISKTNVPLYDERFRQYGFNRISQVRRGMSSAFPVSSLPLK
ncbi:Beta-1,4-glucuronyltransferase 1 [Armadillidium vulgare]|nr:Beta-1,4-glucuronyltransferase 1 [Armadillidium vulgare]